MDYKQELKTESVEKWAQSDLSVPAYINGLKKSPRLIREHFPTGLRIISTM